MQASTLPSITIDGHASATQFASGAFSSYGGVLKVSGRFPFVTRIGSNAFGGDHSPLNANSELIFDRLVTAFSSTTSPTLHRTAPHHSYLFVFFPTLIPPPSHSPPPSLIRDAFPVLVEIGSYAFSLFPGRLRFVNQPFPRLMQIGMKAFKGCHETCRVDLIDQQELKTVQRAAFQDYEGSYTLKGGMPKLETLGVDAFRVSNGLPSTNGAQIVILKDLPSLKKIGACMKHACAFTPEYHPSHPSISGH